MLELPITPENEQEARVAILAAAKRVLRIVADSDDAAGWKSLKDAITIIEAIEPKPPAPARISARDVDRESCFVAMEDAFAAWPASSNTAFHRTMTAAFDALNGVALVISADRKAAIEKVARLLVARHMGIYGNGERLPADLWQQKLNTAGAIFDLLAAGKLTNTPEKKP